MTLIINNNNNTLYISNPINRFTVHNYINNNIMCIFFADPHNNKTKLFYDDYWMFTPTLCTVPAEELQPYTQHDNSFEGCFMTTHKLK